MTSALTASAGDRADEFMILKTRILEVTATLKPAGAENVVVSLALALDPSRFEVGVVSLYDAFPNGLEPLLEKRRIPVWHLGKWRGPDPRMYASLRHLVREFRPDIIHSHCYVNRYTVHLRARAMVHTVHNMAAAEVGCFGRLLHRYAFHRGMVPVAVGDAVADSIRQMYGLSQLASIPNGIDTHQFWRPESRNPWRRRNGYRDEDLLVVSVGRLERQKNPTALVNAMASIPKAHLLIAGEGSLRANLEGRERVHLLGVRGDIPEILAAADIFALASDWEGLPLAIIEAMAAGLPVVATSVGCVPEIIEHGRTGLLVARGDQAALVAALKELAENHSLRRDMGAAARIRSLCFSVDAMAVAYEDLFSRLLSSNAADQN
jgi:glycosyltransferase involved in cell wall biosynthesis